MSSFIRPDIAAKLLHYIGFALVSLGAGISALWVYGTFIV